MPNRANARRLHGVSEPRDADSVAARLRFLRRSLGLSQEQLARRLGVSFATVNRWESGRTHLSARARPHSPGWRPSWPNWPGSSGSLALSRSSVQARRGWVSPAATHAAASRPHRSLAPRSHNKIEV